MEVVIAYSYLMIYIMNLLSRLFINILYNNSKEECENLINKIISRKSSNSRLRMNEDLSVGGSPRGLEAKGDLPVLAADG